MKLRTKFDTINVTLNIFVENNWIPLTEYEMNCNTFESEEK